MDWQSTNNWSNASSFNLACQSLANLTSICWSWASIWTTNWRSMNYLRAWMSTRVSNPWHPPEREEGASIQTRTFSRRIWEVANQEQSKLYETSLQLLFCSKLLQQDRAVTVTQTPSKTYLEICLSHMYGFGRYCKCIGSASSSMMYNTLLLTHGPSYQSQLWATALLKLAHHSEHERVGRYSTFEFPR